MPSYRSITGACHDLIQASLQRGDRALDATAGNGLDTVALARAVGAVGRVWALDRQAVALQQTQIKLKEQGLDERCSLVAGDHASIEECLPAEAQRDLSAVVFNLGYLPGGDKALTTTTASTLHALNHTWSWLRAGGRLVVVCYPGHTAGSEESIAVSAWFDDRARDAGQPVHCISTGPTRRPAPFLLSLRRSEVASRAGAPPTQ